MEQWEDESRPCGDPECSGVAEPEGDADLRYYACSECGFEEGWQQTTTSLVVQDDHCSIGVSAEVRRAASEPMEKAMRQRAAGAPVPLQIGFGPPEE